MAHSGDPISSNRRSSRPSDYDYRNYEQAPLSRLRPVSSSDPNLFQHTLSDFDHADAQARDKIALERHKKKMSSVYRSSSAAIYNRKDQTRPDVYIIYVFLNGKGMDCQFLNFQRTQLEKGMNYVLELIARRFNVNPAKLVNMDGKKISHVSGLMSRGSYVLVPVGQSFRETWYFLPDNAIDTSTDQSRVDDRRDQRDRLIQRRDKRVNAKSRAGISYTSSSRKPYVYEY